MKKIKTVAPTPKLIFCKEQKNSKKHPFKVLYATSLEEHVLCWIYLQIHWNDFQYHMPGSCIQNIHNQWTVHHLCETQKQRHKKSHIGYENPYAIYN